MTHLFISTQRRQWIQAVKENQNMEELAASGHIDINEKADFLDEELFDAFTYGRPKKSLGKGNRRV